ncbi:hypothetical protein EGM51_09760 [Verrucomicrobia bacterium S94]|nr:hypothetical protein EGM51_09760 [Verrucomicrobia bacterium S94]
MTFKLGSEIKFTAVNEKSERLDCIAKIIGITSVCIETKVIEPLDKFTNPPEFDMIPDLIEEEKEGLQYKGEIDGAVMIPAFLWK